MEDFRLEGPACARRSNERPRATLVRDRRLGVRGSNTKGARSKATTPAPPPPVDWLAGHVGLELRNVVANYPFESSRGFPGSKPNSGHRDHSRLRCSAGGTQLGPGAASRGRPRAHVGHIAELTRKLARDLCRSKDDPPAAKPGHHCAVRMRDLATDGDESAPNVHVVNESPT